jgi:transcriptional regulator with XRE-family HTH domain
MDIKTKFWENIRTIRKRQGFSQEKLGQLSWLHRTYIGIVERGEKNISLENILRIADALNVEPKTLFEF